MNFAMIILRLLHIFGGVAWAGTSFFAVSSLVPTVRASGPEGGRFMQRLVGQGRMNLFMGASGSITVLSGLLLLWRVSGNFNPRWFISGYGILLSIGALAGLAAWIYGALVTGRTSERIAQLGKAMEAADGPPSPEQIARMNRLQEKQTRSGLISVILLAIAVIGMSAAQYAWF